MSEHNAPETSNQDAKLNAKRNITFIIPVLLLIALIAGVGYFTAMHSGLDKKAVEAVLKNWSEQLKASSAKNGAAPIEFTYDSVEMEGGPTDRHAVLINPSFATQTGESHTHSAIKTSKARLFPASMTFDSVRIELPEPLQILADDKAVGNIRFVAPLIINTQLKSEDKISYVEAKVDVPTKFTAESYADEKIFDVILDAGAVANFKSSTDGNSYGQTSMSGSNLVVSSDNKTALAVSKFMIDITDKPAKPSEVKKDDKDKKAASEPSHEVAIKADIQELSLKEEQMPYGALTFAADVGYEGPLPNNQNEVDWSTVAAKLVISQLQVKNTDAYVSVKGNVTSGQGDMLPVGKVNINVGNFEFIRNEILKRNLVTEGEMPMMNVLFEQMTGQAFDKAKDIELVLTREANQSLKLGNITLEQGLAIVLSGGKMSPKKAETPDDAAEPEAAPDVPFESHSPKFETVPDPEAEPEPELEPHDEKTSNEDTLDEANSRQFLIQ